MAQGDPQRATLTTREAAALLGCAERTVLVRIQRGELKAERRGKAWHVDAASVQARLPAQAPEALGQELRPAKRDAATGDGTRRAFSYRNLNLLRALGDQATQVVRATTGLEDVPPEVRSAAVQAALQAAQLGAAGCHAFSPADKTRLYSRAREAAAMVAATLWVVADLAAGHAEGLRILAASYERSASSLGALMRRQHRDDA